MPIRSIWRGHRRAAHERSVIMPSRARSVSGVSSPKRNHAEPRTKRKRSKQPYTATRSVTIAESRTKRNHAEPRTKRKRSKRPEVGAAPLAPPRFVRGPDLPDNGPRGPDLSLLLL